MNRFARTQQLLGTEQVDILKNARVAVCGLGAVGSYAVEALARAGVGYLRLVDFDSVDPTNTNRQLFALESTFGMAKVSVAKSRVKDINPDCEVDIREVFIDEKSIPSIIEGPLDVLIDAIDSVSSKVCLLTASFENNIHTVSSMGAAGRMDPSAIRAGDISESHSCPLAKIIRKRLHRNGIFSGIRCVYSPEPSLHKRPPVLEEKVEQTRGRIRTPMGSISYITGIFGLHAAAEAIQHILSEKSASSESGFEKAV